MKSVVNDDVIVASGVKVESLLAARNGARQGTDRHGAFATLLAAAVADDRNPILDFDNWRFLSERRGLSFGHMQLLQITPSRVASFSINWIRFKEHFSLSVRYLAASKRSRLTTKSLSTGRSPSPSGGRSALEASAPAFSAPIKDTFAPIMGPASNPQRGANPTACTGDHPHA